MDFKALTIGDIRGLLPHRFPFLLVDRIVEFEPNVNITGLKNVTVNEPFFQGHFPDEPIMPGVLILEAMAQTGIIFAKLTDPLVREELLVFASIDKVKFRRPVVPGDQLVMKLGLLKRRKTMWKIKGEAYVDQRLCTEAELMAAAQPK